MWHMGLVALWHMGSSRTRARTHVPCIGRQILYHCTTREVPVDFSYEAFIVLRSFPSTPSSLSVFIMKMCWILSNAFLASIEMFTLVFSFILLMWCITLIFYVKPPLRDFPGGAVIKSPSPSAGDMGSIPGPGRSHLPRSN